MTRETLSDGIDRLVRSVEEATTVAHTISQQLEELRQDLTHAIRNHGAEWKAEGRTSVGSIVESIACASCDVDSPPSLAAAVEEGWQELTKDDGPSWNYLGQCPACLAQEDADVEATRRPTEPPKEEPARRELFELLLSVSNKSNRKPYVPLSEEETRYLTEQKLLTKNGKLTKNGLRIFTDLDNTRKQTEREEIAREVAEANAPFPMEDAVAMGLTESDIAQAKAEGVTSALGLRRIEKNNRGTLFSLDE
jgi:hypothetical protein